MNSDTEKREPRLVLVVDDDAMERLMTRETLEEAGFSVEEAEDGVEALSLFDKLGPDIVLLDVIMPRMDGFETCIELRKRPGGKYLPILLATGLDDIDSINRAYEVGASDFLAKPIIWANLSHHVRYMLRSSQVFDSLQQSEERFRQLAENIKEVFWMSSADLSEIIYVSPMYEDIWGHSSSKLYEHPSLLLETIHPEDRERIVSKIRKSPQEGFAEEYRVLRSDGSVCWVRNRAFPIRKEGGSGEVYRIAGLVEDISERKRAEDKIRFLAYYDGLTSLPNRTFFIELLNRAISHARRYEKIVATLFIDLDLFKRINDTFGHSVGDQLLRDFGDRLVGCLRSADAVIRSGVDELDTQVSRLGGDEFTILLTELRNVQDAALVARRILDEMTRPFVLDSHEVHVSASIGISAFPMDGADSGTLLKNADIAMYHAKGKGRNNYQFYRESLSVAALEKLELESELHKALDNDELLLYYQPKLDVRKRKIVSMEALIRWEHPARGIVSPIEFIPLAEETGLIEPIGEWVLSTACAQNRAWQRAGMPPLSVAVNLSNRQFRHENLIGLVSKILSDTGLDPRCLELEITESMIMEKPEKTIEALNGLKGMGIKISVDDFGTGYSSLGHLKRIPLDILKIDSSFVMNITKEPDDAAIVKAIIAMAHSLKLKVIAEGVETEEQFAFLKDLDCDEVQGYLFSRPLSVEGFTKLLEKEKA